MADKSEKRRGLGRGLSALMADVVVDTAETTIDRGSVSTLPLETIHPNPDQPRKHFNEEDLNELADSLRQNGVIQPLIVRLMEDGVYQIVAGERRWRAAQLAQLHDVPVVVREFTDQQVLEVAIIENIQRADLNPIEEATGYRQLMEKFGHTQQQLAEALGKSRSHIANLLRLLQLPPEVLSMVEDGQLSSGHARALITARDPLALARHVVAKSLSVRATEALVKAEDRPDTPEAPRAKSAGVTEKDADTKALEGDLSATLGMRVRLDHRPGNEGGTLSISYRTLDQLDELCRVLSGG